MPWMTIAASVAAPIVGSLIGGSSGSTSVPTSAPAAYVPPNQAQWAQHLQDYMTNYGNQVSQYGGLNPSYANTAFQSVFNNPYAPAYQTAAATGGAMAGQNAPILQGAGYGLIGNAGQVMNTAFDPQSQLYNYNVGQLMNNINAQQAMRGLGVSPQGAQEAGTALGNFQMNWANQQLQRQLAGLQGAGGALTTGGNIAMAAPQQAIYGGQMPYTAGQTIGGNQFGAIGSLGQAVGAQTAPIQQQIQNAQAYLGLGQSGQANAANQAFAAQQQQNQNMAGGAYFGQQLAPALTNLAQSAMGYFGSPSMTYA